MSVYVYALKDPETGRTRYIGQTNKPFARLAHHVSLGKRIPREATRLHNWIQELLRRGFSGGPTMEILKACANRRSATFWEARMIRLGRDEDLLNVDRTPTTHRDPVRKQENLMMAKGYLPIDQVAVVLGVSRQTVWRWATEGKVKSMRVVKHVYIEKESLIAHVGEVARDLLPGATSGST